MEGKEGTPYKIRNRSNSAYEIFDYDLEKLEGEFGKKEEEHITYVPRHRVKVLVRTVDKETQDLLKEETFIHQPYTMVNIVAEYPGYKSDFRLVTLSEDDEIVTIELEKEG